MRSRSPTLSSNASVASANWSRQAMPSRANTTVRARDVAGGSERRVPPQRVDAGDRERPDRLDVEPAVGLEPANVVGERPQVPPRVDRLDHERRGAVGPEELVGRELVADLGHLPPVGRRDAVPEPLGADVRVVADARDGWPTSRGPHRSRRARPPASPPRRAASATAWCPRSERSEAATMTAAPGEAGSKVDRAPGEVAGGSRRVGRPGSVAIQLEPRVDRAHGPLRVGLADHA